jgi:hypothetical protein
VTHCTVKFAHPHAHAEAPAGSKQDKGIGNSDSSSSSYAKLLCHNSPIILSACCHLSFAEAPAGSKKDKGIGKLCKQGSFSTDLNSNATCEPCPDGVTTASEGSTSPEECSLAQKGYYINPDNANEALECPYDTYQDQESDVTSCTPCPNGLKTQDTAAIGVALCLAPPGFELVPGNAKITACLAGWYKSEWNRNRCIPVSDWPLDPVSVACRTFKNCATVSMLL